MDIRTSSLLVGGRYTCTPAWTKLEPEFAECHRLYIARSGCAEFLYRHKTWRLEAGYVYLLPGYAWIRRRCDTRLVVDWLHFRPDSLEMDAYVTQLGAGLRWPVAQWSFWRATYTRFQELFRARQRAAPDELLTCQVQAMLLWMFSQLPAHRSGGSTNRLPSIEQLKPALDYIDRNFLDDPSLDQIAASVHLSRIYFHRCFKQTFHTTPHTYLLRKRMQHAWEQLRTGSLSIREVSERLHFGNPFYFSRAFRRFLASSPST